MAEAATKQVKAAGESVPAKRPHWTSWPALLDRELESFFDDLFEDDRRGRFRLPALLRRRFPALDLPRLSTVDVYQTDDEVVVKAEMPGLAKEDIEVSVSDSTLTVKGEKKREEKVEEDHYTRSERSFGMISRTIELPCEVRSEQATAKMTNGVLEVHVPKTDEAKKQKSVKVKIG
jgi:HSP20 family protein